jgi:hypothetical protein
MRVMGMVKWMKSDMSNRAFTHLQRRVLQKAYARGAANSSPDACEHIIICARK